MIGTLQHSLQLIFGSEGGYVNNVHDKGGATKFGITAATLGASRSLGRKATPDEVKGLTLAEAANILDRQYAQPIHYNSLPSPIDFLMLDEAVMSGPVRAIKDMQATLGVKADGNLGIQTMAAINAVTDLRDLVRRYDARRLSFLRQLHDWVFFGKGWGNRLNYDTATALAMIK